MCGTLTNRDKGGSGAASHDTGSAELVCLASAEERGISDAFAGGAANGIGVPARCVRREDAHAIGK